MEQPSGSFSSGSYLLIRQLGASPSRELFVARHSPSGRVCAFRRLAPELLRNFEAAKDYLHVLLRQARLAHPNVNPVRVIFRRRRSIYVVTDHVEGLDLAGVLGLLRHLGPFSPPVATRIALEICAGLDHALGSRPGEPLVHGSLWPANVVLGLDGGVQITDFGSWIIHAALMARRGQPTVVDLAGHCSPEQLGGAPPTPVGDVYAVGLLLFAMLAGRRLHPAAPLDEQLEPLSAHPALRTLVGRCLAADPLARCVDAGELQAELAVAEPDALGQATRRQLVDFLAPFSQPEQDRDEEAAGMATVSEPAPLEPLVSGVQVADLRTPVSPSGLTEALAALSAQRTDPAALADVVTRFGLQAPDEEPTALGAPDFVVEGGELTHDDGAQPPPQIVLGDEWADPDLPTVLESDAEGGDEPDLKTVAWIPSGELERER